MNLQTDLLKDVNLIDIHVVTLSRMIRSKTDLTLAQAYAVAKAIKEAHRLGVLRGKLLK